MPSFFNHSKKPTTTPPPAPAPAGSGRGTPTAGTPRSAGPPAGRPTIGASTHPPTSGTPTTSRPTTVASAHHSTAGTPTTSRPITGASSHPPIAGTPATSRPATGPGPGLSTASGTHAASSTAGHGAISTIAHHPGPPHPPHPPSSLAPPRPPCTILESFYRAIPDGNHRHTETSISITDSGVSTANSMAPILGIQVSYDDIWDKYARIALGTAKVKTELQKHYLASWEPTRYLGTEADVSDAASPQLMNSVDLALAALYDKSKIKNLNQVHQEKSRADKVWFREFNTSAAKSIAFAVLDYKRVTVINEADFEPGLTTEKKYERDLSDKANGSRSPFANNATTILKQAVHYRARYDTRYVAFFDWDKLVLLVLRRPDNDTDWNGGMWCYITIISEKSKMRRALLAFLVCAYEASVAGDWRAPDGLTNEPANPPQTQKRPSDSTRSKAKK